MQYNRRKMTSCALKAGKKIFPSIFFSVLFLLMVHSYSYSRSTAQNSRAGSTLRMPALIGDNMVLQRDKPVTVWGWAGNGEAVTISIGNETHTAVTNDQGIWKTNLKPQSAGGPFVVRIKTAHDSLILKNIMFGDVWVCSGQSNMQFEVKKVDNAAQEINEANYPLIRLLQVARKGSQHVEIDIPSGKWQECNAKNVANFSAVAYFFGRELLQHTKVPIGLIDASWGGSTIEAWMSADMLQNYSTKQERLSQIKNNPEYIADRVKKLKVAEQVWMRKFRTETGNIDSASNLVKHPDDQNWLSVNLPGYLNDKTIPVKFGVSWYMKMFTIPQGQSANSWELNLGPVTEVSIIYLNGHKLSESLSRYAENNITIPATYLKDGENELLIYALNESSFTGFPPGVNKLAITNVNTKEAISLVGPWSFKQQTVHGPQNLLGARPSASFEHTDYTLLYNAMIAPLTKLNIKGVLWYQGETNADKPDEYGLMLADLVKGWKLSWNFGNMPFYIVQLPNYNAFAQKQKALAWPRLQEVQKEVAFSMRNSGLAVIYDVGNPENIHPKNKQVVGKRLSLVVRNNLYKESSLVCYGPVFKKAKQEKKSLIISFEQSSSDLVNTSSLGSLNNFQIAGEDKIFYPATATIKGNQVVAYSSSVTKPVYVRYAFDCNPAKVNFYNKAGLPAVPFRTDKLQEWLK